VATLAYLIVSTTAKNRLTKNWEKIAATIKFLVLIGQVATLQRKKKILVQAQVPS
jgi:hypothetical protein